VKKWYKKEKEKDGNGVKNVRGEKRV